MFYDREYLEVLLINIGKMYQIYCYLCFPKVVDGKYNEKKIGVDIWLIDEWKKFRILLFGSR